MKLLLRARRGGVSNFRPIFASAEDMRLKNQFVVGTDTK